MQEKVNNFSLSEEIWHAITHGLGLLLSIIALVMLVAFASVGGDTLHIISASVYGTSLLLMYGSSTFYHAVTHHKIKILLQKFDHSAIYFLIAGTYTPIVLLSVGGFEGWAIFSFEWSLAFIGVYLKFRYPNRFELFSLIAYVVMGWIILVSIDTLKANIDPVGFWLIVAGGLSYSGGVVFYVKDHINYYHAIWHIFVLVGSILQFLAVAFYII